MSVLRLLRKTLKIDKSQGHTDTMTSDGPRCVHRHSAKSHPHCFVNGVPKKALWYEDTGLRIGFLDIETTDFKANRGFMLSWAIKYRGGSTVCDVITREDILSLNFDKRIVKSLVDELKNVDIIVTYYGTGFDIPFARTRALFWKYNFPVHGEKYHFDMYYRVAHLLKLTRNSLDAATTFLGIDGKTHFDIAIWNAAAYGDEKALATILDHNIQDVQILEKLFDKLEDFSKWTKRSL